MGLSRCSVKLTKAEYSFLLESLIELPDFPPSSCGTGKSTWLVGRSGRVAGLLISGGKGLPQHSTPPEFERSLQRKTNALRHRVCCPPDEFASNFCPDQGLESAVVFLDQLLFAHGIA